MSAQEELRQEHSRSMRLLKEKDEEIASLRVLTHTDMSAFEPLESETAKQKYSSSNLDAVRLREIADAGSALMDEGQQFCNPDFNLDMLSGLVGSNNKYVSQAINETFGKNFSAYINEYRVNLACRRLADPQHYGNFTVKAIGECGV